jgi:hypothetical protein
MRDIGSTAGQAIEAPMPVIRSMDGPLWQIRREIWGDARKEALTVGHGD